MVAINNASAGTLEVATEGLSRRPKQLPSFLFYDDHGDKLFRRIMQLPEYYLTRCETAIFHAHGDQLTNMFISDGTPFELVELGAGDATKTEILLRFLISKKANFTYVPVDVSAHVLDLLQERLSAVLPELNVEPIHARIENLHHFLSADSRKVFLYLGANIGNFTMAEATCFLSRLANEMNESDRLLTGFDLKKDPRMILSAYDDPSGVTRDFNLNLLRRLNRECGADFRLENFSHYPSYDPESGLTKSFLISACDQTVSFSRNGRTFTFRQWETIHTEVSLKYDHPMIETLANAAGLGALDFFHDDGSNFCDVFFHRSL